jgi:hypothetical protein
MIRFAVVVVLATLLVGPPGGAGAVEPPARVRGEHFVDRSARPVFMLGANYEGPADRAWQMWDDQLFDSALIAQDFDRARAANLSVLRIFVQPPLAADIRAGRWAKLDRVLDLADRRGLGIVLTFADYWEADLAELAAIDAAVAARYRGRPTIFAYDLMNEPHFSELALARYPPGAVVALQDPALVAAVGETIALQDIAEHRTSEQGQRDIPGHLDDQQAHVYANLLAAYRRFLQDGWAWARAHNSTAIRYSRSPDSAGWNPLKEAVNDTLAAWMKPRLDALRSADPDRPVTVGHVDPILASLPTNDWLDYRTLHHYPAASSEAVTASIALFDDVRAAIPGKPLVLGEFGFSTAAVDEQEAAALEAATVRAVREARGAGALKWMLNDFPNGLNPHENAFGMYRADGSAKPVVAALQALGELRPLGESRNERPAPRRP